MEPSLDFKQSKSEKRRTVPQDVQRASRGADKNDSEYDFIQTLRALGVEGDIDLEKECRRVKREQKKLRAHMSLRLSSASPSVSAASTPGATRRQRVSTAPPQHSVAPAPLSTDRMMLESVNRDHERSMLAYRSAVGGAPAPGSSTRPKTLQRQQAIVGIPGALYDRLHLLEHGDSLRRLQILQGMANENRLGTHMESKQQTSRSTATSTATTARVSSPSPTATARGSAKPSVPKSVRSARGTQSDQRQFPRTARVESTRKEEPLPMTRQRSQSLGRRTRAPPPTLPPTPENSLRHDSGESIKVRALKAAAKSSGDSNTSESDDLDLERRASADGGGGGGGLQRAESVRPVFNLDFDKLSTLDSYIRSPTSSSSSTLSSNRRRLSATVSSRIRGGVRTSSRAVTSSARRHLQYEPVHGAAADGDNADNEKETTARDSSSAARDSRSDKNKRRSRTEERHAMRSSASPLRRRSNSRSRKRAPRAIGISKAAQAASSRRYHDARKARRHEAKQRRRELRRAPPPVDNGETHADLRSQPSFSLPSGEAFDIVAEDGVVAPPPTRAATRNPSFVAGMLDLASHSPQRGTVARHRNRLRSIENAMSEATVQCDDDSEEGGDAATATKRRSREERNTKTKYAAEDKEDGEKEKKDEMKEEMIVVEEEDYDDDDDDDDDYESESSAIDLGDADERVLDAIEKDPLSLLVSDASYVQLFNVGGADEIGGTVEETEAVGGGNRAPPPSRQPSRLSDMIATLNEDVRYVKPSEQDVAIMAAPVARKQLVKRSALLGPSAIAIQQLLERLTRSLIRPSASYWIERGIDAPLPRDGVTLTQRIDMLAEAVRSRLDEQRREQSRTNLFDSTGSQAGAPLVASAPRSLEFDYPTQYYAESMYAEPHCTFVGHVETAGGRREPIVVSVHLQALSAADARAERRKMREARDTVLATIARGSANRAQWRDGTALARGESLDVDLLESRASTPANACVHRAILWSKTGTRALAVEAPDTVQQARDLLEPTRRSLSALLNMRIDAHVAVLDARVSPGNLYAEALNCSARTLSGNADDAERLAVLKDGLSVALRDTMFNQQVLYVMREQASEEVLLFYNACHVYAGVPDSLRRRAIAERLWWHFLCDDAPFMVGVSSERALEARQALLEARRDALDSLRDEMLEHVADCLSRVATEGGADAEERWRARIDERRRSLRDSTLKFDLRGVSIGDEPTLRAQLFNMEASDPQRPFCFGVGVLYVGAAQHDESEWMLNRAETPEFAKFMDLIAERVALRNWTQYRGDLDTSEQASTGTHSYFTRVRDARKQEVSVMMHVGPLLAEAAAKSTKSKEEKDETIYWAVKRRVGNDVGCILFVEEDAPSIQAIIESQVCHVVAVVRPVHFEERLFYRVEWAHVDAVSARRRCEPIIESPFGLYPHCDEFANWFMVKMINSMLVAMSGPSLGSKLYEPTRLDLLHALVNRFAASDSRNFMMKRMESLYQFFEEKVPSMSPRSSSRREATLEGLRLQEKSTSMRDRLSGRLRRHSVGAANLSAQPVGLSAFVAHSPKSARNGQSGESGDSGVLIGRSDDSGGGAGDVHTLSAETASDSTRRSGRSLGTSARQPLAREDVSDTFDTEKVSGREHDDMSGSSDADEEVAKTSSKKRRVKVPQTKEEVIQLIKRKKVSESTHLKTLEEAKHSGDKELEAKTEHRLASTRRKLNVLAKTAQKMNIDMNSI